MPRLIRFAAAAVFVLSCAQEKPTSPSSTAKAAALGELVSINGETYRRVAAKQGETQTDYRITITIPVSTQPDGSLVLSNTIEVGGRTYTANCSAADGPTNSPTTQSDDVGNTQGTATLITATHPPLGSTDYAHTIVPATGSYNLGDGDVDYFRLRINRSVYMSIASASRMDTKGVLYKGSRVIDQDDDGLYEEGNNNRNFFLFAEADPGTYYVKVEGYSSSTPGPYLLSILLFNQDGAGKAVAEADLRDEARTAQLSVSR